MVGESVYMIIYIFKVGYTINYETAKLAVLIITVQSAQKEREKSNKIGVCLGCSRGQLFASNLYRTGSSKTLLLHLSPPLITNLGKSQWISLFYFAGGFSRCIYSRVFGR